MATLTTYIDEFRPKRWVRRQAETDAALRLLNPPAASIGGLTASAATQEASAQVEHFRLWVYVAVDRNASKAAENFPNVSILRRANPLRSQTERWLTAEQRRHVQRYYGGLLQTPADDLEPVPDSHPLVELLREVNPVDWWGSFAYETYMFLQLTGAFVWWVVPNGLRTDRAPNGLPAELWTIPTHWVRPIYDRGGRLVKWRVTPYGNSAAAFDLPPDEVLVGAKKNPKSKTDPLSALSAGAEWVVNQELLEKARHLTYKYGNLQPLALLLDAGVYQNPPEELLERVAQKFMARYGRGADAVMKPVVIPPGIKAEPLSLKPNELLVPEMSEQLRDFVLALYGVPKAIAGLAHDLNKASIYGANLIWCEHTIMPLQAFLAGAMTEKLARRYDERLRVWFDDVRPHDAEAEREEVKLDWLMGAISPDERRQQRGYRPLGTPAAAKTYVSASLMPLEEYDAGSGGSDERGGEGSQAYRSLRQRKAGANRARLAQEFDRLTRRLEREAEGAVRRMWGRIRRSVLERLERLAEGEGAVPTARELLPGDEFEREWWTTLRPRWVRGLLAGVQFERRALGLDDQGNEDRVAEAVQQDVVPQAEPEPLPDISAPISPQLERRVSEWLRERHAGIWRRVLETTHREMEAAIKAGIESGEGAREIAARLEAVLAGRSKNALTIARTETIGSVNYGQQLVREEEQVPEKEWIATLDRRTREDHLAVDGQIVPNDEPFVVGGFRLLHPGDSSLGAPPELTINCRCTAVGVYRR